MIRQNLWYLMVFSSFRSRQWQSTETTPNGAKLCTHYADSCKSANEAHEGFCQKNGWSIFEGALLAETGKIDDALEMALKIPPEIFISECGNSLTEHLVVHLDPEANLRE